MQRKRGLQPLDHYGCLTESIEFQSGITVAKDILFALVLLGTFFSQFLRSATPVDFKWHHYQPLKSL